ncbi:hypothetical protein DAMA08_031510 [Martiniozyma asiatica (nom. inval.)]|nr:hypothetical protein DAMA08_031510 [Martiniozyma asiatica]
MVGLNPPNRVLPLDGLSLDNQVSDILSLNIKNAFKDLSLPIWLQRLESRHGDDLVLALKVVLWKFFIWDKSSTYGLILQNLKLNKSRNVNGNNKGLLNKQKILLLLALVLSHFYKKIDSWYHSLLNSQDNNYTLIEKLIIKIGKRLTIINKILTVLDFSVTLSYLPFGKFSNLTYAILNISHSPITSLGTSFAGNPETISYEFQNRQLIWNGVTEFMGIIQSWQMPKSIRVAWKRIVLKTQSMSKKFKNDLNNESSGVYRLLPIRCCAICYDNDSADPITKSVDNNLITNAWETNCGHVYCYLCLMNKANSFKNELIDDSLCECLRCGSMISSVKVFKSGIEVKDEIIYSSDDLQDSESDGEENDDSSNFNSSESDTDSLTSYEAVQDD